MTRVLHAGAACAVAVGVMVAVVLGAGDSAMTKAVKAGDLQAVRALVKQGADVNARSGDGSTPLLWADRSPFAGFMAFCDWLFAREGRTHGIPLVRLAEAVFGYLVEVRQVPEETAAAVLWADYQRGGRSDRPLFLRKYLLATNGAGGTTNVSLPARQARHVRANR